MELEKRAAAEEHDEREADDEKIQVRVLAEVNIDILDKNDKQSQRVVSKLLFKKMNAKPFESFRFCCSPKDAVVKEEYEEREKGDKKTVRVLTEVDSEI